MMERRKRRKSAVSSAADGGGAAPQFRDIPPYPSEAGQRDELVIKLSPRRSVLNAVCEMVEKFGEAHDVPDGTVFRVNLAIDELLTNYVLHRLDKTKRGRMEVRVRMIENRLVLVVLDTGPPFDPRTVAAPPEPQSLDDIPVGGVGLHLVRTYADELDYREVDGCNILRLEHVIETDRESQSSGGAKEE